jgi:hypothetical protein
MEKLKPVATEDQAVAIIMPGNIPYAIAEELMKLVAFWFEEMGFVCFCCGEPCETASVINAECEFANSVALMMVPACNTCAEEAENGNKALMDMINERVARLVMPNESDRPR